MGLWDGQLTGDQVHQDSGVLLPNTEAKIVRVDSENSCVLEEGGNGEVLIKGPQVAFTLDNLYRHFLRFGATERMNKN